MPSVETSIEALAARGQRVSDLLRPICPYSAGPASDQRSLKKQFIVGAHGGAPTSRDYLEWRFATNHPNFAARYFERWTPTDASGKTWCLQQAYLTIFKVDRDAVAEDEIICLHCDPNTPDNADHAAYKRGPHFHITVAGDPYSRAHLALHLGYLDQVLDSVDSLSKALSNAMTMLSDEVFSV